MIPPSAPTESSLTESSLTCSILSQAVGVQRDMTVHAGDVDEGRITWEAPTFHGLTNSNEVTASSRHWYRDENEAGNQATGAVPSVAPTPTTAAAQSTPGDIFKQPNIFGAAPGQPQGAGMFQFNADGSIKW